MYNIDDDRMMYAPIYSGGACTYGTLRRTFDNDEINVQVGKHNYIVKATLKFVFSTTRSELKQRDRDTRKMINA